MKTRDIVSSTYERLFPYAASGVFLLGRAGTDVAGMGPIPDELAVENGIHRLKTLAYGALAIGTAYAGANILSNSESSAQQYVKKVSACASAITGHEVRLEADPEGHLRVPITVDREVAACQEADGKAELARFILDHPQVEV